MGFLNVEIKAKCSDLDKARKKLVELRAKYEGLDHQVDTYFNVEKGKLKLREGNIENNLIFYERQAKKGPKLSSISTHKVSQSGSLKEVLLKALGGDIIVDKQREIYWINNVKFHLDRVKSLGTFIEIEAIDYGGDIGKDKLLDQCNHYLHVIGIKECDLITNSYSDMLRTSNASILKKV